MIAPQSTHGLTAQENASLTHGVTRLSLAVALVLTLIKAVVWLSSGSVAMQASLADSGLDVFAALATFYAVRYAVEPPDQEHRFGHGKAEAFGSLIQAGLVFASAALVAREAGDSLRAGKRLRELVFARAFAIAPPPNYLHADLLA